MMDDVRAMGDAASGKSESIEGNVCIRASDLKDRSFDDLTARNFPLTTYNRIVQGELVKQVHGIGVMQESVGEAERSVTRALPHLDRVPGEMWLVAHSELRTNRRIRSVFDFLASELTY
jgi:DNA-binding transcriptional LysR family regulator